MLHTPENSKGKRLVDSRGVEISNAVNFDDVTNEVTIVVTGINDSGKYQIICSPLPCAKGGYSYEVIKTKVIINGAKMVDRKPIKEILLKSDRIKQDADDDTLQTMHDEMTVFNDYHASPYKNFNQYFNDHITHWKAEIGGERFCSLYNYLTIRGHLDDSSI